MSESNDTSHNNQVTNRELVEWFYQMLNNLSVSHEKEPYSEQGFTRYDYLYYQLEQQAAHFWQQQRGCVVPQATLRKAFYAAEFQRFKEARQSRPWWQRLKHWMMRKVRRLKGRID